jgi:hypothetical protein
LGTALAAAASFGLLMLPVAVGVLALVARRTGFWPESLGTIVGLAGCLLLIGFLNLGANPCPDSGVTTLSPGEHEASCGGLPALPFLAAGAALAAAGVVAYWRVRSRR